ncbi:hypothetical protein LCGC14_2444470, partial [marine sediment metagenome]
NLGLIVRKKFTDLRDSTMKDFVKWTASISLRALRRLATLMVLWFYSVMLRN